MWKKFFFFWFFWIFNYLVFFCFPAWFPWIPSQKIEFECNFFFGLGKEFFTPSYFCRSLFYFPLFSSIFHVPRVTKLFICSRTISNRKKSISLGIIYSIGVFSSCRSGITVIQWVGSRIKNQGIGVFNWNFPSVWKFKFPGKAGKLKNQKALNFNFIQ